MAKTPAGLDYQGLPLSKTQIDAMDELYPLVDDEFTGDENLKREFTILAEGNTGGEGHLKDAFVRLLAPKIAKIATDVGHPLSLPLYGVIARHIATEWALLWSANQVQRQAEGKQAEPKASEQAEPKASEQAEPKASEQAEPKAAEPKASEDDTIIPQGDIKVEAVSHSSLGDEEAFEKVKKAIAFGYNFGAPPEVIARTLNVPHNPDSANTSGNLARTFGALRNPDKKADRSKPVLTVAVLRGMGEIFGFVTRGEAVKTKGHPDVRTALKYMSRLAAWKALQK